MTKRPVEEWEYLDSWLPRMTRKTCWLLGALTAMAVAAFLIGDMLIRLLSGR